MRNLKDFQDEQALDLLAEIFEPMVNIMSDNEFITAFDSGKRLEAVKIAIKKHKEDVMLILASMDGVPVEEYHCNFFTLPVRLIEVITEIMKEPELMGFFVPQSEKKSKNTSGSVTENTEEKEQ